LKLLKLIVMTYTAKLKILVVEDDDMNYIYLKQIFKILGCEHERVNKGISAIESCRNIDFDLIMMDIKLPDINGYEVTKTIRTFNADIPIIAQTASKNPEDHEMALEAGCDYVMVKPYKIEDIREMFQKLNISE
jgi:CheY-like chemotaxis protein